MVDQSSGSAIGGSSNYSGKSPDELVTHGKQLFQALGNMPSEQRDTVMRQWQADPAIAQVFSRLTESTA